MGVWWKKVSIGMEDLGKKKGEKLDNGNQMRSRLQGSVNCCFPWASTRMWSLRMAEIQINRNIRSGKKSWAKSSHPCPLPGDTERGNPLGKRGLGAGSVEKSLRSGGGGRDPDSLDSPLGQWGPTTRGFSAEIPPGKARFGEGSVEIFPGIGRGKRRVHKEVPPAGGGGWNPGGDPRDNGKTAGNEVRGGKSSIQMGKKNPKSLSPPATCDRAGLTLSKQFTFSVGYTIFPQRAQLGFMAANSCGRWGGEN